MTGCGFGNAEGVLPTLASLASLPTAEPTIPLTFTPLPGTDAAVSATPPPPANTRSVTSTPIIPTNTPVPPTNTPSPTVTPTIFGSPTPVVKPISQYALHEVIPYQAFPVPPGNNGWGMHWVPTVSQEPGAIDQLVAELVRMHIKWVIILNEGTNIGDNDYLVDKLVANGIMPVMRLYRSALLPYDGQIGPMVRHYRGRGVYYYQLYNEPNINVENNQGFANPDQYARMWAIAAREVVANGGLPGIGALSPGGQYDHFEFLERTLNALNYNGDAALLNHAWLSVHNYHGTRPYDDPNGFLLFREYDKIVRAQLGRSLPIIGTEGGSYSNDLNVELDLIRYQYNYMRNAEPYFLAFSYWLLANRAGGGNDDTWEWQTLIRPGWKHPAVTEFFYRNGR